jgi:16S rRNA (cytidine1402-2'-O)-methyltransferase
VARTTSRQDETKRRPAPPLADASDPTGSEEPSKPRAGLHLVAVPIGNLGDVTLRALATLKAVDAIACEDTRSTGALLGRWGIDRPLLRYDEHNAGQMRPRIVGRIAAGEAVALVSDAGTPLISDPGYKLVRAVQEAGLHVTVLPGASAVISGLLLSGLPTDRFLFAGFPPARAGPRRAFLGALAAVDATLILFEAPHRLVESLADMAAVFPGREAAVVREITKLFEESRRGPIAELAAQYAGAGPPRGEIVVAIGPPPEQAPEDDRAVEAQLRAALATMRVNDAAAAVAGATGRPRREVYALALRIAADGE